MLIAISPDGVPVVVALADAGRWDEMHRFGCTTPHYVAFFPDVQGRGWSWPKELPRWLYGLPANLVSDEPTPDRLQRRYSAEQERQANAQLALQARWRQVDPHYVPDHCKTSRSAS
jgi:hypothetical protein